MARYHESTYQQWERQQANRPKQRRMARMCETLPYCLVKWQGREILYNRAYKPLWERDANGVVTRSTERYNFTRPDQHFYVDADGSAPWDNARVLRQCEDLLREWGIPLPAY
jgi:hypothetical protein